MTIPLSILIVEDSEDDTLLLMGDLREMGYIPKFERVETAEDMRTALKDMRSGIPEKQWDIIISDQSLPSFDAKSALQVLKETDTDLPFIVLSGVISDHDALELMYSGAKDYFKKGDTSRLGAVIQRELKEIDYRHENREALGVLHATERYHASIMDVADDAIITINEVQRICFFNKGACNIFGFNAQEVLGQPLSLILPENTQETHQKYINNFAILPTDSRKMGRRSEITGKRKDGSTFLAEASISKVSTPSGYLFTAILRDVTLRYQTEVQMKKLSSAVERTSEVVIITDADGIIEYVNPAFTTTTGYQFEEAIGKTPEIIKSGKHDQAFYQNLWNTINNGDVYWDVFINKKKDGSLFYEEKTITPVLDNSGNVTNFVATSKDISDRIHNEERMHQLAYHDPLTELPNRTLFMEYLQQALSNELDSENRLAVMILDLDRFKTINDTLGHDYGDKLLQILPERLLSCIREQDTLARLGGDEFCILLKDVESENEISNLSSRIIEALTQPFQVDGHELFITTSIGISRCPDNSDDAITLMRYADKAMYQAKEQGRNSFRFYLNEDSDRAINQLTLENKLRRALEREEFLLHYQPQVAIDTGQIIGAEALIRWQHPDLGLVSPMDFIPLLEETGLIVPVGEWVLTMACQQNRAWQKAGLQNICIAVNLSPRQFIQATLSGTIEKILDNSGLNPAFLDVEITEGTIIYDTEKTIVTLHDLKSMGVSLSIDDFGTGYSSLSYLKRLPINTIKIDRSFITDLTDDKDSAAIVDSIIAMAKSMKMAIIAEGVETEAQLNLLADKQCNSIQGYYFSKPLPPDEFTQLLCDKRCLDISKLKRKQAD